ncbi:MAG: hypothetical protein RIS88_2967 [Pseudomonadota bacterium]|jgi:predicted amidohydrolase
MSLRAATIQMVSGPRVADNLEAARTLLAQAASHDDDGPAVLVTDLDPARVHACRQQLPALDHRVL